MEEEITARIEKKIEQVEEYLDEVDSVIPDNLKEYEKSNTIKRACERYFQLIAESIIDLAFFVIIYKKLEQPMSEDSVFDVLFNGKVISASLRDNLKDAKSMRNFIIHRYGEIDDAKVYYSLSEELEKHAREFIVKVREIV